MGCSRYGQSPNPTKIGMNKRAKSQISQLAVKIAREKNTSFLEEGDLDTGEGLPINVFVLNGTP